MAELRRKRREDDELGADMRRQRREARNKQEDDHDDDYEPGPQLEVVSSAAAFSRSPMVSLLEEHHHVLAYYLRARHAGKLPGAATVLHIDSHADMGVPNAFLDAFPDNASSRALEAHTEINDFLVMGAYMGLMDHIVFVEPPWSNQFRCCVYETNATFDFVVGVDDKDHLRVDVVGDTAQKFARERFGHVFWRDGERRTGAADSLRRVRPFKVTVAALELPDLPSVLADVVGDRPLVLDVDLDAFATVSPGAIATRARFGLTEDQLETLYHLIWNFPDLGVDYLKRRDVNFRDGSDADSFVQDATRFVEQAGAKPASESRLAFALGNIVDRRDLKEPRRSLVLDYAAAIDKSNVGGPNKKARPLDARSQANLEAYVDQPFHVPTDFEPELDLALNAIWKPVLAALPDPFMVNVVRSPGYMPDSHLPATECAFFTFLDDVYAANVVHVEDRVHALRTRCDKPKESYRLIELPRKTPN